MIRDRLSIEFGPNKKLEIYKDGSANLWDQNLSIILHPQDVFERLFQLKECDHPEAIWMGEENTVLKTGLPVSKGNKREGNWRCRYCDVVVSHGAGFKWTKTKRYP